MQKVRRAITRLIDAYQDGLLNKSEFEPRIKSSKERLVKLESESSRLAEAQVEESELRLAIGHLEEFSKHVHDGLDRQTSDYSSVGEASGDRTGGGPNSLQSECAPLLSGSASGASLQNCLRGPSPFLPNKPRLRNDGAIFPRRFEEPCLPILAE